MMKKKIFVLMLGISICGISPVFAMAAENEPIDIRAITPIKSGMNANQREQAIRSFLKESLRPESQLKTEDISDRQSRQCGVRNFDTYTLNDGSEWVMGQGGLNRFLGYLYLKKALEYYDLETLCVAETRFAYKKGNDVTINIHSPGHSNLKNIPVIDSLDFFSLSHYVGNERPTEVNAKEAEELSVLRTKIGFTDIDGYSNLRRKDGKIWIIDTEFGSFSSTYAPYFDDQNDLVFTFPKTELSGE